MSEPHTGFREGTFGRVRHIHQEGGPELDVIVPNPHA